MLCVISLFLFVILSIPFRFQPQFGPISTQRRFKQKLSVFFIVFIFFLSESMIFRKFVNRACQITSFFIIFNKNVSKHIIKLLSTFYFQYRSRSKCTFLRSPKAIHNEATAAKVTICRTRSSLNGSFCCCSCIA